MKLAEALILRADMRTRMAQLQQRMMRSAKVQEGDAPAEEPTQLMAEFDRVSAEFTTLVQRINRTNTVAALDGTQTLADALAVRDTIKTRHKTYSTLADQAVITHQRFSASEVRFRSTVNVAEIQQLADDLARQHRELDARIQAMNWMTDLQ